MIKTDKQTQREREKERERREERSEEHCWEMSADDLASLPPTAPGGGDFGVALNNRTDTIDESNIGGPSRLKLKVRPAPPQYPYADTFFSFEVLAVRRRWL